MGAEKIIMSSDTSYVLCDSTESRFRKCLTQEEVILINETLLLKFGGRLAALALETKDGFKEGFWYCPSGKENREAWRVLYEDGVIISPDNSGEWVEVREIDVRRHPNLLKLAKRTAASMIKKRARTGDRLDRLKRQREPLHVVEEPVLVDEEEV